MNAHRFIGFFFATGVAVRLRCAACPRGATRGLLAALVFAWMLSRLSGVVTNDIPHRYLFVMDTSFSMSATERPVADFLVNSVNDGLGGRFQTGDIVEAWAFTDEIHARVVISRAWLPELNLSAAAKARQFIESMRYEKRNDMTRVIPELVRAAQLSPAITILLISDGDQPIKGTPFDGPINLLYEQNGREMRRQKRPFITVLIGRNGHLVGWAVNALDQPLNIPAPPSSQEPPVIVASAGTNRIAALVITTNTVARAVQPPSTPVEAATPIKSGEITEPKPNKLIVVADTPVEAPPVQPPAGSPPKTAPTTTARLHDSPVTIIVPAPSASSPPKPIEPPPVAPRGEMKTAGEPPVNPPATIPAESLKPAAAKPVSAGATSTNHSAKATGTVVTSMPTTNSAANGGVDTPPVAKVSETGPTNLAVKKIDKKLPPAETVTTAMANNSPTSSPALMVAGIALLSGAVLLGILMYRPKKTSPHPSLISKSMDRRSDK